MGEGVVKSAVFSGTVLIAYDKKSDAYSHRILFFKKKKKKDGKQLMRISIKSTSCKVFEIGVRCKHTIMIPFFLFQIR